MTHKHNQSEIHDPHQNNLIYPQMQACASAAPPELPNSWFSTAILHPFSPPYEGDPQPDTPFFQLCTANIEYFAGAYFSAQITGCSYGQWWYIIYPDNRTVLSRDRGSTWKDVDMGWNFPTTNWFGTAQNEAECVGSSYLNWMEAQRVDWWKLPVPNSNAATWYWFNSEGPSAGLPFRLMFGQPPQADPQPLKGDPNQLALFQMYSFTYFPTSMEISEPSKEQPEAWIDTSFAGFSCGNPDNFKPVIWNPNFGMTSFMTPVDESSNPLQTRVLYTWKPDNEYVSLTDRGQNTLMWYLYNPTSGILWEEALMFGIAPKGTSPPPHSGSSFLIDQHRDGSQSCQPMPSLGQEPPDWAYFPQVEGKIQATIHDNPTLCPNEIITIISVLFPPSEEYPQGRYLWTWYSPFSGSDGTHSRPVTFMESASTIAEGGTSLALADYFDYQEFAEQIDPSNFVIPNECLATPSGENHDNA